MVKNLPVNAGESEVKVKAAQSCPTLCDSMDYTDHGILQARILEWIVSPFSKGSSQPRKQTRSPALQADSLTAESQGKPVNAGDMGSIPGSGRSPREGNGSPLQYSCLGNPMDRGAWQGAVHRVTKESAMT